MQETLLQIEQIILRSRYEEESFLIDTAKAAFRINELYEKKREAKVIQMETLSEAKTEFY